MRFIATLCCRQIGGFLSFEFLYVERGDEDIVINLARERDDFAASLKLLGPIVIARIVS